MKTFAKTVLWMVVTLVALSVLTVLAYRWLPVPVTPLMVIRYVDPAEGMEAHQPWQHEWVPLDQMSEWMPKAVVASEDQRFYRHHGFDFEAIQRAIDEAEAGKRQRGGSTISQQTAKNVFLWPGRSWLRKGMEAYFTVLIEALWPKDRIMEVYLNSIEMGPGIYGLEAVAQEKFGKSAKRLTKAECALIAATLPNPIKRDASRPTRYLNKRKKQIMRYM